MGGKLTPVSGQNLGSTPFPRDVLQPEQMKMGSVVGNRVSPLLLEMVWYKVQNFCVNVNMQSSKNSWLHIFKFHGQITIPMWRVLLHKIESILLTTWQCSIYRKIARNIKKRVFFPRWAILSLYVLIDCMPHFMWMNNSLFAWSMEFDAFKKKKLLCYLDYQARGKYFTSEQHKSILQVRWRTRVACCDLESLRYSLQFSM